AVTFTEAATAELRRRVRRFLKDALQEGPCRHAEIDAIRRRAAARHGAATLAARLEAAEQDMDQAAIFTIHGFCHRVLKVSAFESRVLFQTELATDTNDLLREVVCDFWRREIAGAPAWLAAHAAEQGLTPDKLVDRLPRQLWNPELRLLPEALPDGEEDPESAIAELNGLRERLCTAWREAGDEVITILRGKGFNKNTYSTNAIEGLVADLDAYCRSRPAADRLPAKFVLLTRTKLSAPRSINKGYPVPEHPFFDLCDTVLAQTERSARLLDDALVRLEHRLVEQVRRELPRRKEAARVRGFDDLLRAVREALAGPGGEALGAALRARYRAVLVDEFQDTDPIQYEIFQRAFGASGTAVFYIGDPKQSIYSFRGADIFAYLRAAREPGVVRHTMTRNYRSTPGLLAATARLFGGERPFVIEGIELPPVAADAERPCPPLTEGGREAPALTIWTLPPDLPEWSFDHGRYKVPVACQLAAHAVAAEIRRLLDPARDCRIGAEPFRAAHAAVLVRSRTEAQLVKDALQAAGVPAVLSRADNVFGSPEAEELELVLRAAAAPSSGGAVRAALLTDALGLDLAGVDRLAREAAEWEGWLEQFHRLHDAWTARGLLPMLRRLDAERGVRGRLLGLAGGERRVTNFFHVAELLHGIESECGLGMAGVIGWLAGRRAESGDERVDAYELRLESDADAVQVLTMHRSKGLEFPVVFLPFPWSGGRQLSDKEPCGYHDDTGRPVWDYGCADRAQAKREKLAEDVRLLYVSVTRARCRCYFAWDRVNDAEDSAPAYLFHRRDGEPALPPSREALLADLAALRGDAPIEIAELPLVATPPPAPAAGAAVPRKPRQLPAPVPAGWRVVSYSVLKRGAAATPAVEELPDHDPETGPAAAPAEPAAAPGEDHLAFPRGVRAGTALHAILERIDFAATDCSGVVEEQLRRHGLARRSSDGAAWGPGVARWLQRVLAAPLADGLRLADIGGSDRVPELEFWLPLRLVTPADLAALAGDDEPSALAAVSGYLRGYIDLVFRHAGRYYLLDWKSNHLGAQTGDYLPERLAEAMRVHHYDLQLNLYVLALHRYLARTLPGYDYDRHVGGAFY
ncbi:MAG TPA: exodeoxyribonuclease V subunit beta, partial [Acidobacteriota bacterium]|nr:exodeoxyribonuclease V subunit beta [Acidobacteriota bacterium]